MMVQVKGLKVGLSGFGVAAVGAVIGFAGFLIEERWLSITGLLITAVGVTIGFGGIVYGWVTEGKRAIKGGVQSARELRDKFTSSGKDNN